MLHCATKTIVGLAVFFHPIQSIAILSVDIEIFQFDFDLYPNLIDNFQISHNCVYEFCVWCLCHRALRYGSLYQQPMWCCWMDGWDLQNNCVLLKWLHVNADGDDMRIHICPHWWAVWWACASLDCVNVFVVVLVCVCVCTCCVYVRVCGHFMLTQMLKWTLIVDYTEYILAKAGQLVAYFLSLSLLLLLLLYSLRQCANCEYFDSILYCAVYST